MAAMFHMPVSTRRPNAGHAIRLNRRATARGASAERSRRPGTRPARVIWPPTQTAAASTWRNSRTVAAVGDSTVSDPEFGEDVAGGDESVLGERPAGQRPAGHHGRRGVDHGLEVADVARRREVLVLVGDADLLDALAGREPVDHLLHEILRRRRAGGDTDDPAHVRRQL